MSTHMEQMLIEFDPTKEHIERQVYAVCPTRNAYPETQKYNLTEQLSRRNRIFFERDGVIGMVETKKDALEVAATFARYRYSISNAYISDLGAGVYTMLTQDKGLYDKRELLDSNTGDAVSARVLMSMETLYKALLGPVVRDDGRALSGAGPIVREAKNAVLPVVDGKVPMPRAYASIERKRKDGVKISAMIEGEPIRIYRKVSGACDAVIIDLDYFFFPAIKTPDGYLANDQFLHQVAGLTSFLSFGRRLLRQEKTGSYPDTTTARRILLAAQAAYELRYFAPGIVRESSTGRVNVVLRRRAVKELYPSAVDTTGRIRFADFSKAVAFSGLYFRKAMDATGIAEKLPDKVLIPAQERGAEFPQDQRNVVYIKADRMAS